MLQWFVATCRRSKPEQVHPQSRLIGYAVSAVAGRHSVGDSRREAHRPSYLGAEAEAEEEEVVVVVHVDLNTFDLPTVLLTWGRTVSRSLAVHP